MEALTCTQEDYNYEIERIRVFLEKNGGTKDLDTATKFCQAYSEFYRSRDGIPWFRDHDREYVIQWFRDIMRDLIIWTEVNKKFASLYQ